MKKTKKLLALFLITVLLISSFMISMNKAYAEDGDNNEPPTQPSYPLPHGPGEEVTFYNEELGVLYGRAVNGFEINPNELLMVYSDKSTGDVTSEVETRLNINDKNYKFIPYVNYVDGQYIQNGGAFDGKIDAGAATFIFGFFPAANYTEEFESVDSEAFVARNNEIKSKIQSLIKSLSYSTGIATNNIKVTVTVRTPDISTDDGVLALTSRSYNYDSETGISFEEVNKDIKANRAVRAYANVSSDKILVQQVVSIRATTTDGREYALVLGTDNNFYFVTDQDQVQTEIKYVSKNGNKDLGGKMEGITFISNYDKDLSDKDIKVTAHIISKTGKEILTVNDVALNEDGTPNQLGWKYENKDKKDEIVKVYPFVDYDNLEYNGKVKEEVTLGFGDNIQTKETVSIKWQFRIIKVEYAPEEITDDTKEVTVKITTNLPIDETKLPLGWKFTDDEEGKTQHKIYKVFNREDGDAKELVELIANGRDDKVEQEVKVTWPKKDTSKAPDLGPQAGVFTVAIIVVVAGVAAFAITRYRKLNK